MAENGDETKPDESNFLETIEDGNGDSGTTPQKNKQKELNSPETINADTQGEITAAVADNYPGIVETLERSDGSLFDAKRTLGEGTKDPVDAEKVQPTQGEEFSYELKSDLKDGWHAEEPSVQALTTIDPHNTFPDPPINPLDSLQTLDGSNLPDAQNRDSTINSSGLNSSGTSDKKIDPKNYLQNYHSLHGISAEQTPGRRQSKDSIHPQNLSVNRIRNEQTCRRSTILKPKSSLREPEYKHQPEEFLDNDMLISNTKLDGLLFKLFSLSVSGRDGKQLPFVDDGKSDIISMEPVIWNLRPMSAIQRETLDSEMEFLEDTLMPKQVVRQLFMDGILTHMDYNQIMRTEGQGDKAVVRLLIGTLKRRGEKAFPHFMKILKDLNYSRVWERLEATERILSESLANDQRESERRSEIMERLTIRSVLKTRFKEDENNEEILREFLKSEHSLPLAQINSEAVEEERYGAGDLRVPVHGPSPSSERTRSRHLEHQLNEINTELKALHESLNLLQSARLSRSSTGGVPKSSEQNLNMSTRRSTQSADKENPQSGVTPQYDGLPLGDTEQPKMVTDSSARNNNIQQKSGTCIIL